MTGPPRDRHIPDLVTLQEAAEILGVVKQYAHRLATRGQLLGATIGSEGKVWVFRRVVVERLRDQRKPEEPPPEPEQARKPGDRNMGD